MKKVENVVEYKSLDELFHLDNNPRTITKDNMDRLVQSIKDNPDYFEARPIICSDRTGKLVIIAGNQRLRAAGIAGLTEVPVVTIHGLTEEREREITIRDNVELGDWDMDLLANEWDMQELNDWGVAFETEKDFGTNFELPDGDKDGMQVMSFNLATEQAEAIKAAMKEINLDEVETFGNTNSNGNKLYGVIVEWEKQKK